MQIVFHDGSTAHDLDVVVHDPDALVCDLARALRPADDSASVIVDGVAVPGERRLDRASILEGATISLRPADDDRDPSGPVGCQVELPVREPPQIRQPAQLDVAVVGGLDAGARTSIGPGTWAVGRDRCAIQLSSLTVSARHATIDLTPEGSLQVSDESSCNGTWVQGVGVRGSETVEPGTILRLGATQITLRPVVEDDRPTGHGGRRTLGSSTIPFNRPPRPVIDTDHVLVDPPRPAAPTTTTSPVGIMSIIAPLLMAGIMVKLYGNPVFAMFALLSPVMLVGNALESRRRRRKGRRRDRKQFDRELSDFRRTIDDLGRLERERLEAQLPDPAEVMRRIVLPSTHVWERRLHHDDALLLRVGIGTIPWAIPIAGERRTMHSDVRDALARGRLITDAPVLVDLSGGGVVGLVGDRGPALALARSLLVQAATHHGPADLTMTLLTDPDHGPDWDWAKWLPHTLDPGGCGRRTLSADDATSDALLRSMLERGAAATSRVSAQPASETLGPIALLVLDDESLTEGRRSPARSVLRGSSRPVAGMVIAATEDRLPAMCSTIIELVDRHGTARVHRVQLGQVVEDVLVGGMSEATARRATRALARFEDPELEAIGAGLPAAVGLLALLGLDPPDVEVLLERWQAGGRDPDLRAPIGVTEDGVLELDLVRDGPHGLVAGTTGSGKSELLRSLVAGLAVASPPDHLAFVLIDFKGGSAFDQCALLPHTVGLVTDLDAHLAQRALRCLEAELRRRERLLRDHGVADLQEYRRLPAEVEPLPRLMVVVDEFATLRAELGGFVDSLVDVAQRGRSLGMHLVLATQRPGGAVNDSIRSNANLRIALRVQDAIDSTDVIDGPDAAQIRRDQPGRALARLGPGETVLIQTALSSGSAPILGRRPVVVRPFRFGTQPPTVEPSGAADAGAGTTDLQRLVSAMVEAHARSGRSRSRRPWPDPLPPEVDLDALWAASTELRFGARGSTVPFALADDPDSQDQYPVGWMPADGNLLLIGMGGSGTTTAAASLALSAAVAASPGDLHLYLIDFGAGELAPLAALPHVGALITAGERERQVRLMRWLGQEINRRRALPDARTAEPRLVLILDGLSGFRSEWDDAAAPMTADLQRVFGAGPEVGIHSVVTADRASVVPGAIQSLTRQRWLFRLGDPSEFALIGVRAADVPDFHPGGALTGEDAQEVQVGRPADGLAGAVARIIRASTRASDRARRPQGIGQLPDVVRRSTIAAGARADRAPWTIPVGISERTLMPAGFALHDGGHALVAGPPRSGRSTTLVLSLIHI